MPGKFVAMTEADIAGAPEWTGGWVNNSMGEYTVTTRRAAVVPTTSGFAASLAMRGFRRGYAIIPSSPAAVSHSTTPLVVLRLLVTGQAGR
jgi:hypothetical protein